jgi:hypothetical protein
MARNSPNPLSEHARHLQEEQERIQREMAAMEKELRRKPKVVRPRTEPERRIRVNSQSAIDLPRPREHVQRGAGRLPSRRTGRRRRSDIRLAQIKLLLLCLLILGLALFVWKNLPG